ncbi:MAG: PEP/pyruvate-binding domain-containing protein [bacterium]|nr:PEP/pyruvate-binding domain-containing protein [bacterium]
MPTHIKPFSQISKKDVAIAGGKGASLGEMTSAFAKASADKAIKIAVPPGFVVLADAFDRFLEETQLTEEIQARLKEAKMDDTNSVDRASAVIRDTIHDRPMPADLTEEILEAFDKLFDSGVGGKKSLRDSSTALRSARNDKECFVAVRSSATAEDSSIASWAGELETYLNTTRENVVEKVKQCWSSLFTPRAIFYRHEKNLIDHYVSVAVVVQKMVQSEISGVAFTVHPVTEDRDQMIIEAGYGLGEAIVSGQITPDSYVVSKSEMSIMDINIGEQTRKLVKKLSAQGGPALGGKTKNPKTKGLPRSLALPRNDSEESDTANEWVELGPEGAKQKLTGKQIIAAAKAFKAIEDHYGFPCDIEWAMVKDKIYITQSRPITTLKK